jgi:hypothetical protein
VRTTLFITEFLYGGRFIRDRIPDTCTAKNAAASPGDSDGRMFAESAHVFFAVAMVFEFGRPKESVDKARVLVATFTHVRLRVVGVDSALPAPERI